MIDEKKLIEELEESWFKNTHASSEGKKVHDQEHRYLLHLIERQPKISLENKTSDNMNSSCNGQVWIPVSERLPEKDGTYLVTTKNGAVTITHFYPKYKVFNSQRMSKLIIAWMPMPKPYKALQGNCEVEE